MSTPYIFSSGCVFDSSGSGGCPVFSIPKICDPVDAVGGAYSIAKLSTKLQTFTNNTAARGYYSFSPSELLSLKPSPTLCPVSSGVLIADSYVVSSGGVCLETTDTTVSGCTVVDWHDTMAGLINAGTGGGPTTYDVPGGYCIPYSSGGGVLTQAADPTPAPCPANSAGRYFGAVQAPVGHAGDYDGGGGSSGGAACNVFVGVVTDAPTAGYGTGRVAQVTFNTDGSYTARGNTFAVVFPYV